MKTGILPEGKDLGDMSRVELLRFLFFKQKSDLLNLILLMLGHAPLHHRAKLVGVPIALVVLTPPPSSDLDETFALQLSQDHGHRFSCASDNVGQFLVINFDSQGIATFHRLAVKFD